MNNGAHFLQNILTFWIERCTFQTRLHKTRSCRFYLSSILRLYENKVLQNSLGVLDKFFLSVKWKKTVPRRNTRHFIQNHINYFSKSLVTVNRIPQAFIFGNVIHCLATFLRQSIHVIVNLNEIFLCLSYPHFKKF